MARVLMKGCEAIAEAAVRAGCRFFAGYPITPQNEIPEYFARRLPEVGGNFVQGESEVASVNMVYGAAAAGTRSMTSSSSPGISLKSEGISYCAAARVPIVYSNISRGGPGVGAIQPAQQDYFQATKASGNGVPVLYRFQNFSLPLKSPHPCFYTRNIDLKTVKNQAIPVHQALPQVSLQAQEQSASLTILWKERSQAS